MLDMLHRVLVQCLPQKRGTSTAWGTMDQVLVPPPRGGVSASVLGGRALQKALEFMPKPVAGGRSLLERIYACPTPHLAA